MRRLLSAFFRTRSVVSASLVILVLTLATKVTGLGRVATVATLFGAGGETDAFLTAFLVPECIYLFFTEGALTAALVPVLTRWSRRKDGRLGALVGSLLFLAVVLGLLVALPLYLYTATAVAWLAPGFGSGTLTLTASLLRIVLPYVPLLAAAGVFYALLHTEGHFTMPALGPLLFNLSIIAMAFLAHRRLGIAALAWGVLLGGLAQLFAQFWPLRRLLPGMRLSIDLRHPGLIEAGRLLAPIAMSLLVVQGNVVGERILASSLAAGSITELNFAQKIIHLPLGIFGIALSTAILPTLARLAQEKRGKDFARVLGNGLSVSFLLLLPLSALMIFGREWIVSLALKRGAFAQAETLRTAGVLGDYAIALAAVSATMLLTRAFLARNDARTPAALKALAVALHLGLCWTLLPRWGIRAVPLAFAASSILHFILAFLALARRSTEIRLTPLLGEIGRILLSTVLAFALSLQLSGLIRGTGKEAELARLALLGGPGFLGSLLLAHLMGCRGTREGMGLIRERMGRGRGRGRE